MFKHINYNLASNPSDDKALQSWKGCLEKFIALLDKYYKDPRFEVEKVLIDHLMRTISSLISSPVSPEIFQTLSDDSKKDHGPLGCFHKKGLIHQLEDFSHIVRAVLKDQKSSKNTELGNKTIHGNTYSRIGKDDIPL